jgi:hypothetical protein
MFFTFRIDLDYVPWDTPDAVEFGHSEPAMLLRLLELAKFKNYRYQFFISNRVLRALPTVAEAAMGDGHALDWFCKHPEEPDGRFHEALALFSQMGHVPRGMAVRGAYPAAIELFDGIGELRFLSAAPGPCPPGMSLFPVETKPIREGLRAGTSARSWCDAIKTFMRDAASRSKDVTVDVRPQVLGKHDPKLTFVKEILELATALDFKVSTCRDLLEAQNQAAT